MVRDSSRIRALLVGDFLDDGLHYLEKVEAGFDQRTIDHRDGGALGQVLGRIRTYIGLSDRDWFNFLSNRNGLDEVNF